MKKMERFGFIILNQKMEITDKFEDGVCFVQLKAWLSAEETVANV